MRRLVQALEGGRFIDDATGGLVVLDINGTDEEGTGMLTHFDEGFELIFELVGSASVGALDVAGVVPLLPHVSCIIPISQAPLVNDSKRTAPIAFKFAPVKEFKGIVIEMVLPVIFVSTFT